MSVERSERASPNCKTKCRLTELSFARARLSALSSPIAVSRLRAPYSDMMKSDDGESILTWSQITAMTQKKEGGLRPSLPEGMDDEVVRLVRESWSSDAALRPSFGVIVIRLAGMGRSTRSIKMAQDVQLFGEEEVADEKDILSLCRGVHDLLAQYKPAHWSDKEALSVVDEVRFIYRLTCTHKRIRNSHTLKHQQEAKVTATNSTLNDILSTEKGPTCIKSLAWMMFAGIEDGAKIVIEPLLDTDVTFDLENKSARRCRGEAGLWTPTCRRCRD